MKITTLFFALLLFACAAPKQERQLPVQTAISQAHNTQKFVAQEAIRFDLELYFRGKKRLDATLTSSTASDFIKIERRDGAILTFDGSEVLLHPDTANWRSARFDVFTWQYFALAPFKLQDPGTVWSNAGRRPLFVPGDSLHSAKLTFASGTGDAPDDWYIAYQNAESGLLEALAYIVTFSKDQQEAEKEPHAITYGDYKSIGGVPFAHSWKFWNWSEAGLADQLGKASLSNVAFIRLDSSFTAIPQPYTTISR
jgi:hypothetical protein